MRLHLVLPLGLLLLACKGQQPPQTITVAAENPSPALTTQERRMIAAAYIALPPEGLSADSLPDPHSRGAQILTSYCTQCHALPSPAQHAAQDWPSVARRMWVRIDMLHGELGVNVPTSADRVALLNYLLVNSLKVSTHLPAGAGRDVFETTCGRCHTLPDPRTHSPPDWPAVITRMERNMERMRVSGVTNEQAQQIIHYLEAASQH
jgi:cytochrome c5